MHDITITVQVSIPVSMTFDDGEQPSMTEIRKLALENFIHHPALGNTGDLEMYVDSIGNGEIDVTAGPDATTRAMEPVGGTVRGCPPYEECAAAFSRIVDLLDGEFKEGDESYVEEAYGIAKGYCRDLVDNGHGGKELLEEQS